MKQFSVSAYSVTCLFLFAVGAYGQYYNDVDKVFVPFEFEWTHRGTFNMSYCSRELINCWEFMRPDAQCSGSYIMESACTQIRRYCNDVYGDMTNWGTFEMIENYCNSAFGVSQLEYTRRSAKYDKLHPNRRLMSKNKSVKVPDVILAGQSYADIRRKYFSLFDTPKGSLYNGSTTTSLLTLGVG